MIKKGIIMEVHQDKAIVLNASGQFDEINATSSMNVGDEIEYGNDPSGKILATLCSIFLVFGSIFGFNFIYKDNAAVSYVAVDINPGVEFTVNSKDRVISASPTNADGELVLSGLDYSGQNVQEAISSYIDEACKLGYIDEQRDDNAIMITVVNDDEYKATQLQNVLYANINQYFLENHILGVILGEETNEVLRAEAMKEGLSAGKLRLVKQAVKANPELTQEAAAAMPVRELNKVIENNAEVSGKSVEELVEQKETAILNVAMFRSARMMEEPVENFETVLSDYQSQKTEEDFAGVWDSVNQELNKEEKKEESNDNKEEVTKDCKEEEKDENGVCPQKEVKVNNQQIKNNDNSTTQSGEEQLTETEESKKEEKEN